MPEFADRWRTDSRPPEWTRGLARKGEVLSITSPHGKRGPQHMSIRSKTGELRAVIDRDGRRCELGDIRRERIELNDRITKRLESRTTTSYWKQPPKWNDPGR